MDAVWMLDSSRKRRVLPPIWSIHHHHDVRLARISLTLSLHVSLSFIAFGRSSGLHPVSSHSCCMNVRVGRPAFDWPYAGVHWSTSLTISSLLLQQCPACLVRLACIVFVIGGRWPYSWRRVGCCCQDLFNIARKSTLHLYWVFLAKPCIKMIEHGIVLFFLSFPAPGQFVEFNLKSSGWLIGFNDLSTCLGLFYAKRLENSHHCMFIFTFFFFFFAQSKDIKSSDTNNLLTVV